MCVTHDRAVLQLTYFLIDKRVGVRTVIQFAAADIDVRVALSTGVDAVSCDTCALLASVASTEFKATEVGNSEPRFIDI